MERSVVPKSTGMKRTGSGSGTSKSSASSIKRSRRPPASVAPRKPSPEPVPGEGIRSKRPQTSVPVALCWRNSGNIDLDVGKFYRLLPDRKAKSHGYLRVIDESGE